MPAGIVQAVDKSPKNCTFYQQAKGTGEVLQVKVGKAKGDRLRKLKEEGKALNAHRQLQV